MHRPAIIAILMFGSVTAQGSKGNPEQERLRLAFFSDLESGDPLRIAKAAVGLGDAGVKSAVPTLRKTLGRLHEMDENSGLYPTLAVLDTLVRLRATVPGKELGHLLHGHALPAAMMLMAQTPREYQPQLLRVFVEKSGCQTQFCWLAAGNMLAKLRSKPFAKLLLTRMRIFVSADLIPTSGKIEDEREPGRRRYAGVAGLPHFQFRGYTPFGLYQLDKKKGYKSEVSVADGPVPIFGRRLRPDRKKPRVTVRSKWQAVDITARQLEWAALLLKTTPEKLPMRARMRDTLFYRGTAAYKRDIARLRTSARGSVSALANRLRLAGLIGKDEAVRPSVEVIIRVLDRRGFHGAKLPELPGVTH